MALSIMAFAYGIAARFVSPDVEATKLKACVAHLREENSRLMDRLSVRLDELNDVKRQLAEARIEARLQSQPHCGQTMAQYNQIQALQNAFAHPWMNEIAECCGGGRARHLLRPIGGAQ